jgi:hypothetical protein
MAQETSTLCLRNLPSLEKVEILQPSAYIGSREHFSLLIELLSSDDQFLPALCEITIKLPTKISLPALADMLVSRWRGHREGVAKLKSFHLAFSHSAEITASAFHELTSRRSGPGRSSDADKMIAGYRVSAPICIPYDV